MCGAVGREGVRYPWGDEEPDEFRANFYHETSPKHPTPVGMYPEGATPSGIQDLAGNVFEWASDELEVGRLIRGGSCDDGARGLRVSDRSRSLPAGRSDDIGFRCVRELLSL